MQDNKGWNIEEELDELKNRKPESHNEAENRFEKWGTKDPYPHVSSSLLNSSEFCDYIVKTGMLYPFYPNEERIKIATYDIALKGRYVDWHKDSYGKGGFIRNGDKFKLSKNSISFVTLEPYLRIPDYIALRFNLKIKNVYKGLLLGTGPIVDPGFEGRLSIPLHNLTTNDYYLKGGDPLISVEFTKLSRHPHVDYSLEESKSNLYIPFYKNRKKKNDRDVRDYLSKAAPHMDIRSSIPQITKRAEEAANKAQKYSRWNLIAAGFTILIGFAAVLGLAYDLGRDALEVFDRRVEKRVEKIKENSAKIDSLEKELINKRE